jgi:prefoldin subunit 5
MAFEKDTNEMQAFGEVIKVISTNTRRIRSVEQRLDGLEMRMGSIEEKIINEIEGIKKDFEEIHMYIRQISKNLSELRAEMLRMDKIINKTAKRTEVKELESLLDLYSPIKSKFATRDEVERLIEEKLSKKT